MPMSWSPEPVNAPHMVKGSFSGGTEDLEVGR